MAEYIVYESNRSAFLTLEGELTNIFLERREEIVRCRDCKRHAKNQIQNNNGWIICERGRTAVQPDGFCAWGKRRSNG